MLAYFDKKRISARILVLESGNTYKNIVNRYPNLDLALYTFHPGIQLAKKISLGAEHIQTPLVCLCTDDDLVIKDAIDQCVTFLLANPDYAACQGYHALFDRTSNGIDLMNILWYTPSLEKNEPLNRLHDHITRYQPVCWAVFRTENFIKLSRQFGSVSTLLFSELLWSSLTALSGKIKRLPVIYCMRMNSTINMLGHPLYLFLESPQFFLKEYHAYRNCLEKAIDTSLSSMELRRILDLIHTCLFQSVFTQGGLRFMSQKVLEIPDASILDYEIFNKLKYTFAPFEENDHISIKRKLRTYRLARKFLHPEPADEIFLENNFHYSILDHFDDYPEI